MPQTTLFFDAPLVSNPKTLHRLAYRHWPKLDKANKARPVVCVHGLTRNADDFGMVAEALSATRDVFALDVAGRGQSAWLPDASDYNYGQYVADANVWLKHLNVGAVDWLGTSMGGLIGIVVAATKPETIARLVLNDIGPVIPPDALNRLKQYVGVDPYFANRADGELRMRTIYDGFGVPDDAAWEHLFAHGLTQSKDGSWMQAYDPAIGTALRASATQDVDLWQLWGGVKCPLLILRGAQSDILSGETVRIMQSGRADATVVTYAYCGHAPSLMRENEIDTIAHWLG